MVKVCLHFIEKKFWENIFLNITCLLIIIKYNFKELYYLDFFKMIREKKDVLLKVKSNVKYLYENRDRIYT